jgi:23S rRNA (pseudouridine1915-N3)-methyltransferase
VHCPTGLEILEVLKSLSLYALSSCFQGNAGRRLRREKACNAQNQAARSITKSTAETGRRIFFSHTVGTHMPKSHPKALSLPAKNTQHNENNQNRPADKPIRHPGQRRQRLPTAGTPHRRPRRQINRKHNPSAPTVMKVQLLLVGKTTQDFVRKGMEEYTERLKHYLPFETEVIPDIRHTRNLSPDQIREKEGDAILRHLRPDDRTVLLDEHGREFTSATFAAYIEKKTLAAPRRLIFVIGGPYGFPDKVHAAASEKISLSRMTFSHQLIRLLFAEQLYRAMTILNNHPYHHE